MTDTVSDAILRILFSILDRDGDDIFSLEELRTVLKPAFQDLSYKRIESAFNYLDKKRDGKLSCKDFEPHVNSALEYGFQRVLSSLDTNRNRKISLNEINEITTLANKWLESVLGSWAIGLKKAMKKEIDDVWAKLIMRLDNDYDNQLSLHEIKKIVRDIVQLALHAVDTDGDDKVSLEELKHIANPDMLPETLLSLFDENGDGELSYTEFNQAGDFDVINTVTQALGRLGGGSGSNRTTTPTPTIQRPKKWLVRGFVKLPPAVP